MACVGRGRTAGGSPLLARYVSTDTNGGGGGARISENLGGDGGRKTGKGAAIRVFTAHHADGARAFDGVNPNLPNTRGSCSCIRCKINDDLPYRTVPSKSRQQSLE